MKMSSSKLSINSDQDKKDNIRVPTSKTKTVTKTNTPLCPKGNTKTVQCQW